MATDHASTVADDDEVSSLTENAKSEKTDLVEGRVWRRINSVSMTESSGGPVLRTTVKPVKRFRPDSNAEKTNPSPSRKKKVKSVPLKGDDPGTSEAKKSSSCETVPVCSPDRTQAITVDSEKPEDCPLPIRKKRVWEQWSIDDKNFFFEAVAVVRQRFLVLIYFKFWINFLYMIFQYGKDFEAIRSSIAQKHRKKGQDSSAKTKEQVRHFYYRTWAMINKMIHSDSYPPDINKAFQELYALINYGELRKKLGGNLKKKGIEKLNELVKNGTTSARLKGKNFRIKTPSCRALKKLSPEYQGKEGALDLPLVSDTRRMKIPLCVMVELYPLVMADWNQVHSYSHNPRLRVRLPVENQLSSLFSYLEKKWKPPSGRLMSYVDRPVWSQNRCSTITRDSKPPSALVLQTPSDVSVNTRIMVFQVSSSKTHAIVSYALRKSTRTMEKSAKEVDAKSTEVVKDTSLQGEETTQGSISEAEGLDSCLSSEEDFDYDSANEEAIKPIKADNEDENSPNKNVLPFNADDCAAQTLDTCFTLKTKENFITQEVEILCSPTSVNEDAIEGDASALDNDPEIGELDAAIAQDDSKEGTTEESGTENVNFTQKDNVQSNNPNVESDEKAVDSSEKENKTGTISQSEVKMGDEKADFVEKENIPDSKLVSKTRAKRKHKSVKNRDFIKAVQSWTMEDCGSTTIAQIYMMLGKPSVFKLCYHWVHSPCYKPSDSVSSSKSLEQPPSFSSGLLALIQAAKLSRQIMDNKSQPPAENELLADSDKMLKTASIQCDLLKSPAHEREGTGQSSGGMTKRAGRGLSKMVSSSISSQQAGTAFAIPAAPVGGRKKNAGNASFNTKISPETVNILLQRERLRNKLIRRPIVVERSSNFRPVRTNQRSMKTFSIVTQGSHKVKFLPSETKSQTFGESIVNDTQNQNIISAPPEGNLLAQAAHEAGVLPSADFLSTSSANSSIPDFSTTSILNTSSMVQPVVVTSTINQELNPVICNENFNQTLATPSPNNPAALNNNGLSQGLSISETLLPPLSWTGQGAASSMTSMLLSNAIPFMKSTSDKDVPQNKDSTVNDDVLQLRTAESDSQYADYTASDIVINSAMGLDRVLNTPQKILPSDSEDSFDGILLKRQPTDVVHQRSDSMSSFDARVNTLLDEVRSAAKEKEQPSSTDVALDLQLPCLMSDNSVDLMSKFQDLVRHTTEHNGITLSNDDDNALDRPISDAPFDCLNINSEFDNG